MDEFKLFSMVFNCNFKSFFIIVEVLGVGFVFDFQLLNAKKNILKKFAAFYSIFLNGSSIR